MKKVAFKTQIAIAVIAAMGLTACNDAGTTSSAANTTTPVSKTTSGVISGFGSVFINGVEYETDGTTFIVDGVEGDESLLKLGMVVSLSGVDDGDTTGEAVKIEFEDEVEGLVIANNVLTDGTLNIMGLTVHTDEDTVFESNDVSVTALEGIKENNVVEVSGYSAGDGSVWATRVEVKRAAYAEGEEIELKGIVSALTSTTFMIGDMLVDYTSAELDEDLASGLADGMLVKVQSKSGLDGGTLLASEIKLKSETGKRKHRYDADDEKVELEGVITAVISSTEIEINGAPVVLDASTVFKNGDATTALVGLKVKAIGTVTADEKLLAERILYKPTGDLKLEGAITALDSTLNTVTMFGKTIVLNTSTMVKDEKESDGHTPVKYKFGVDDLAVGDWLKIKAYYNTDTGLVAMKMKRDDNEDGDNSKLTGKIESIDALTFQMVIAGISVDYSGIADMTAIVGNKIEIEGDFVDGLFVASKYDIEDDDEYYIGGKEKDEDDESEHDDGVESDDESHDHDDSHEIDESGSDSHME